MFNEQLEKLIEMALIDGVLTDKEREILKRKAVSQGFDEDEFEMVLEAKLYEKQQNNSPSIHFQNKDSVSIKADSGAENLKGIHLLFKKITDIENESKPNYTIKDFYVPEDSKPQTSLLGMVFGDESASDKAERKLKNALDEWELKQKEKIINTVKMFPIENSKEEIIEFLTYSTPLSIKGGKQPKASGVLKVIPQFTLMEAADKYENEREESDIINENRLNIQTYPILLRYNWKLKSEQYVVKGRLICENDNSAKNQIEEFAKQLGMKTEGGGFFGFFKK